MGQMQGVLAQAGPEIWAELIDYSPFPDRVNRKLKEVFLERAAKDSLGARHEPSAPILGV